MASNRAKESLDLLLTSAIRASFHASGEDVCDVSVVSDVPKSKETQIVVITISSYLFRFVFLLYCEPDEVTKQFLARYYKKEEDIVDLQSFKEFIGELANVCCGKFNRDLAVNFPQIGMSTPNFIERRSVEYLSKLNFNHTKHLKVEINQSVRFYVGLCVADYGNLDFQASVADTAEDSADSGELELF